MPLCESPSYKMPSGCLAMTTSLAALKLDATSVEEVVVTGVRGVPRTVVDSPTPVDAISNAEIQRSGRAGAFQALQTLVPSFNLPARAGGGTSTVIATGGLRGLNPDQTLVLVNGKRLNMLYGAQIHQRPPRFRIFVNDPRIVTRDYGYWVENELRDRFDLEGVPVNIDFVRRT